MAVRPDQHSGLGRLLGPALLVLLWFAATALGRGVRPEQVVQAQVDAALFYD